MREVLIGYLNDWDRICNGVFPEEEKKELKKFHFTGYFKKDFRLFYGFMRWLYDVACGSEEIYKYSNREYSIFDMEYCRAEFRVLMYCFYGIKTMYGEMKFVEKLFTKHFIPNDRYNYYLKK